MLWQMNFNRIFIQISILKVFFNILYGQLNWRLSKVGYFQFSNLFLWQKLYLIILKINFVFRYQSRDWCKKNWTGLDSTIKMDIFSMFWLQLLLHSHIGALIFQGVYQKLLLSPRVLRNTLCSRGTHRTQIQRFCK